MITIASMLPTKSPRWSRLSTVVKAHLSSVLHFLKQVTVALSMHAYRCTCHL